MKQSDIKNSFDMISPNKEKKQNLYEKTIKLSKTKKAQGKAFYLKRAIPVMAIVLVAVIGINLYDNYMPKQSPLEDSDLLLTEAEVMDIASITDQFTLQDKTYIIDASTLSKFGFPLQADKADVGEKIATISKAADISLIGCDVYEYIPADALAVVAVKIERDYELFVFSSFESYSNNQDENTIDYLKLYGINSSADIKSIDLEGGESIRDTENIEKFYEYYCVLENSSDAYFRALTEYEVPIPPVTEEKTIIITDENTTEYKYIMEPYEGSATYALANASIIRIHTYSGLFFEAPYYPNIGFISRHEISEEFSDFINSYIK